MALSVRSQVFFCIPILVPFPLALLHIFLSLSLTFFLLFAADSPTIPPCSSRPSTPHPNHHHRHVCLFHRSDPSACQETGVLLPTPPLLTPSFRLLQNMSLPHQNLRLIVLHLNQVITMRFLECFQQWTLSIDRIARQQGQAGIHREEFFEMFFQATRLPVDSNFIFLTK